MYPVARLSGGKVEATCERSVAQTLASEPLAAMLETVARLLRTLMNRSKIVAIVTGAISLILAVAYLVLVQLLDFRGEMIPAPQSQVLPLVQAAMISIVS